MRIYIIFTFIYMIFYLSSNCNILSIRLHDTYMIFLYDKNRFNNQKRNPRQNIS